MPHKLQPEGAKMPIETPDAEKYWEFGAALAGAVTFALMQERSPWPRIAVNVVGGFCAAVFLSPWAAQFVFAMQTPEAVRGLTYVVGLLGMIITGNLISMAERYAPDWLSRIITRVLGPGVAPPPPPEQKGDTAK